MKIFQQLRRQARARRAAAARPALGEGNRTVLQEVLGYPVQTKLRVSAPGDAHEREADAIADRVMAQPEAGVQRKSAACEEEDEQKKKVTGKETDKKEEEEVRRKAAGSEATVTDAAAAAIGARRDSGQPLPAGERAFFESRLGTDLGRVRVHTDPEAARLSAGLSARAFTVGNDVFFGSGEYQPGSSSGRRLLAHELAHVLQQSGRNGAGRRSTRGSVNDGNGRSQGPVDGTGTKAAGQGTVAPMVMRSVIFSSTIDIRYRSLRSRNFSITKSSIRVTADAGYPNPATCGSGGYDVELVQKGMLWNSSQGSRHYPNGVSTTQTWSDLATDKTYYLVITVSNSPMNPSVCALVGNITVEE
jgi:hypothetical protein